MSELEYSNPVYPDFAAGFFYAVTTSYAKAVTDHVIGKPLFRFDDVYLTGILAEELNATRWLTKLDANGGSVFF
jgi:hypothetical protein